jgi:hypothetical protein
VAIAEELLLNRCPNAGGVGYDPLDLGRGARYASDRWALTEASFGPLRAERLANPQTLSRDDLVAYYASMGWLADFTDEVRLPLIDAARELLTAPEYRRPWEAHVHWTRLAAGRVTRPQMP